MNLILHSIKSIKNKYIDIIFYFHKSLNYLFTVPIP